MLPATPEAMGPLTFDPPVSMTTTTVTSCTRVLVEVVHPGIDWPGARSREPASSEPAEDRKDGARQERSFEMAGHVRITSGWSWQG